MRATVIGLAVRPQLRSPMQTLESGTISVAGGLEGDRRGQLAEAERKVTVLFESQWEEACGENGGALPWTARRANILVRGLENPRQAGALLRIGGAELEVAGECDPCSRMDEARDGLRKALVPDWRGGVVCRVRRGGQVALGDSVETVSVTDPDPQEVLDFWFREVAPERRFSRDAELDEEIRRRFCVARERALAGAYDAWTGQAPGALALLILLDQFSRNLFRMDGRAFEADARAREIADAAIAAGHDQATGEEQRSFFYLPFMHSENLVDQDRCVALFAAMPGNENGKHHARQHRDVIERFGRFPHRNRMLGRASTPEEEEFLSSGGYAP